LYVLVDVQHLTDDAKAVYVLLNELQHQLIGAKFREIDKEIAAVKPNVLHYIDLPSLRGLPGTQLDIINPLFW
jgi:hypothetical protein